MSSPVVLDPASKFSGHTAVGEIATKAARDRLHINFGTASFVPVQTGVVTDRVRSSAVGRLGDPAGILASPLESRTRTSMYHLQDIQMDG